MYFELGPEKFSVTGRVLLDPGFTTVMTWQALTNDEELPEFKKNQTCNVEKVIGWGKLCVIIYRYVDYMSTFFYDAMDRLLHIS